tara:strand:- start:431 stop:733 length:303 start_codon:yes stop_codon:yes gene_type:complete
MVGDPGIEPGMRFRGGFTVPCHTLCHIALGLPGEIRTPDLLIRSQMLYPAELRAVGTGCRIRTYSAYALVLETSIPLQLYRTGIIFLLYHILNEKSSILD